MARSYKKTPIFRWCRCDAGERKEWKRKGNRRLRAAVKREIARGEETFTQHKQAACSYLDPADGKHYWDGVYRGRYEDLVPHYAEIFVRAMRK